MENANWRSRIRRSDVHHISLTITFRLDIVWFISLITRCTEKIFSQSDLSFIWRIIGHLRYRMHIKILSRRKWLGSIGYHQLDLSIIRRKYRMYSIRIQQTCHGKFEIYVRYDFSKFHNEETHYFNICDQCLLYIREKISTRRSPMNVKYQLRLLFCRNIQLKMIFTGKRCHSDNAARYCNHNKRDHVKCWSEISSSVNAEDDQIDCTAN